MISQPELDYRFKKVVKFSIALALLTFTIANSSPVTAQDCDDPVGTFFSLQGKVFIGSKAAMPNQSICPADRIDVAANSRAGVYLTQTHTLVRMNESTTAIIKSPDSEESFIDIFKGIIHLFTRRPTAFGVKAPYATAMAEGTEFVIDAAATQTSITVVEGTVRIINDTTGTAVQVRESETGVSTDTGLLSSQTLESTNSAVFWAVSYPRIGEFDQSDDNLKQVSFLLDRGQHRSAARLLESALLDDPRNVDALAFQSLIATSQNRVEVAKSLAKEALAIDWQSWLSHAALSFALQASFDLSAARQSAMQAVQLNDSSVYALARLSEVEISLGNLQSAREYALTSRDIDPDYARSHTMIGFVDLNLRKPDRARDSFERAIELDSADAMPRLGLGLVYIKNNQIEAGRQQIEQAVSLAPLNSLLRSYLGKAFYEEDRPELADDQYALARKLDSRDPTPWYYDAISLSPTSTPVDELEKLEQAIRLNDNRSIYRSRLALDSDLATRNINLSRIYQQLGFSRLATIKATQSLGIDPSNFSAHGSLAAAYAKNLRHEVARVSEFLQSQLLNPLNADPISPENSFPYNDGTLDSGASLTPGHYEYTSVFEMNGPRFRAAAEAGENDTIDGNLAASFVQNNTLLSAGISGHDSDGYRANNDTHSATHNVFSQWTPDNRFSVQAEYRHRTVQQGDLRQQFDPDAFSVNLRRDISADIFRIGSRIQIANESTLLLSGVSSHLDSEFSDNALLPDSTEFDIESETSTDARQLELQNLWTKDYFNLITGIGGVSMDRSTTRQVSLGGVDLPQDAFDSDHKEYNAYLYFYRRLHADINITLGAGYSRQENDDADRHLWQPKLGLQWQLHERAGMRLAWFKTLKRFLVADQSIEPTQIAGFNQFYDDSDGTTSERLGIALDLIPTDRLAMSLEVSRRESDFIINSEEDRRKETIFNAEIAWTISNRLTVSANIQLNDFDNPITPSNAPETVLGLETLRIPLSVTYFINNGTYIGVTALFLQQNLTRYDFSELTSGSTDNVLGNLAVGYRFAQGKALVSLNIHNLTDKIILYQDARHNTAQVIQPTEFTPERRISLQANYYFN